MVLPAISQEGGELSGQLAEANSALQAAQQQVTSLLQQLQEAELRGHESSAAAESSAQQLAEATAQLADSQQQVGHFLTLFLHCSRQ